jgi:hypothetical protein
MARLLPAAGLRVHQSRYNKDAPVSAPMDLIGDGSLPISLLGAFFFGPISAV